MFKRAQSSVSMQDEYRPRDGDGVRKRHLHRSEFSHDKRRHKRVRSGESQESNYESDRAHWAALKVSRGFAMCSPTEHSSPTGPANDS